jgi:hypothetical protein
MNNQIRIGSLDFQDVKDSLKNFLKDQSEFTDYNFEGAGITQLLNILAYNSHYDALAANYLGNEMFLDTATKRSSIVSRAKELGYTPRSRRSSKVYLNMIVGNVPVPVNGTAPSEINIPRGTRFTTSISDQTYTFTTINADKLKGGSLYKGIITAYEGILVQNIVIYDRTVGTVKIPNVDIDTTTLTVEVREGAATWVQYYNPKDFLAVSSISNVFMLQEGFSGYEIYFGDNVLGKTPTDQTQIRLTYVVTSGAIANGALTFSIVSTVPDTDANTTFSVKAASVSYGGLDIETPESIKMNATNVFGSQNRAVTAYDYAALAKENFSSVKDILSWDGASNIPPRFGKIMLCAIPMIGDVLKPSDKVLISSYLATKSVGNITVEFADPSYINVELYADVKYDPSALTSSVYVLEANVRAAITAYFDTIGKKFKGVLRYSSLVNQIDSSDVSIIGNETYLKVSKYLPVKSYANNNFVFSFINALISGSLISNFFYDSVSPNKLYLKDSGGIVNIYYNIGGQENIYISNVGTVNYDTGDIVISGVTMSSLDSASFKIFATPSTLDIYSSNNVLLTTLQENINIDVVKETK